MCVLLGGFHTVSYITARKALYIISYNQGSKATFHIWCSNLPITILDFEKLCMHICFEISNFLHRADLLNQMLPQEKRLNYKKKVSTSIKKNRHKTATSGKQLQENI